MRDIKVKGVVFLTLVFLSMTAVGHTQALSRQEMIQRELTCISQRLVSERPLVWADVCYTSWDKSPSESRVQLALAEQDDVAAFEEQVKAERKKAAVSMDEAGALTVDSGSVEAKTVEQEPAVILEQPATPSRRPAGSRKWYSIHPLFLRDNPLTKFEIGGDTFFYKYREPGLMKQDGFMYGMYMSYSHRFHENAPIKSWRDIFSTESKINMFKIDLRGAYGKLDYVSNGTGQDSGIPNYAVELRGVFGYDIPAFSSSLFTPYLGLGYRYLLDDGGGRLTTTGHWGYDRESSYVYIPLGLETNTDLGQGWSLGFNVEYDIFVDGEQTSHLEDGGTGMDALENDQNKGYGFRGSFRIMKKTDNVDFICEPFIRYWDLEDSEVSVITVSGTPTNSAGIEPENDTTEYGVKFGIRY